MNRRKNFIEIFLFTGIVVAMVVFSWVNQALAQAALLAPDLIVLKSKVPNPASQGEDISGKVRAFIKNQGNAEARDFHVDIMLKGWAGPTPPPSTEHMLGRAFISGLGPGRSAEVTFPGARIPPDIPPGDYQFCAIVDSTNVVRESKEDNNSLCQKIKIKAKIIKPHLPPKIPIESTK
ncbi:MAG: hypothetical protein HXY46_12100 [Syntrophaceae bacterium]|nr:hypothetical protein [Syntrophaceae bacterium]